MKKVLSLVLAVMMVFGMSTVAFAAGAELGGDETAATFDFGTMAPGESDTFEITLAAAVAAGKGGTLTLDTDASTSTALGSLVKTATAKIATGTAGNAKATVSITIDPKIAFANMGEISSGAAVLVFNDSQSSAKTLTVTLYEGAILYKEVPTGYSITGFSDDADALWTPTADSQDLSRANMESFLPLVAGMFEWEDKNDDVITLADAKISESASVRSSQLGKVGVRKVYQKGTSGTIRDADLRDSKSDVRVRTVQYYNKTKETDVELKLALTFKGSTSDAPEWEYSFTIENKDEIIEEGQTEASSYGNIYLKADATVRNVEFQGDDEETVFATKTVVKGQKYYFNVSTDLTDADSKIIADNPEVDSIYTVYQTNMANATVQFKDLDREFFVYDAEGKLLGTTKDSKLPLAGQYILTTAKVDFGTDEEPAEETSEEPAPETSEVEAPPMGGGEVVETPVTYNPNTGC